MQSQQDSGIKRQIELPWSEAFKMSMKSIRIRFWRSMITAAGIFLGIAFLQTVLTTSAILEGIGEGYDEMLKLRRSWLVVMSLLVSTVGVGQLDADVRHRALPEIGTMKCLGALDKLVVKLFLIEAALTGIVASVAGSLVGMFGMLLVHWIRFGSRFGPLPTNWGQLGSNLVLRDRGGQRAGHSGRVLPRLARLEDAAGGATSFGF